MNAFYISGGKDRLFKPFDGAKVIKDGGHFMIVDKAKEVNTKVNSHLIDKIEH